MDWLDAMNRAVEYLEDNITEKLDIEIIKIPSIEARYLSFP